MTSDARYAAVARARQGGFSIIQALGPAYYSAAGLSIDSMRIRIETSPPADSYSESFIIRMAIINPATGTFAPSARLGPNCGGTEFTDVNQPWVIYGQNWYALENTLSLRFSSTPGADTRCEGGQLEFNGVFKVAEYIQLTGATRAVIRIGVSSNSFMSPSARPIVKIDAAEGGEWLRDLNWSFGDNFEQTINPSATNIYPEILSKAFNQAPNGTIFVRHLTWLDLNFSTNTFAFSDTQPPAPVVPE